MADSKIKTVLALPESVVFEIISVCLNLVFVCVVLLVGSDHPKG
jgi:hypothetical protein